MSQTLRICSASYELVKRIALISGRSAIRSPRQDIYKRHQNNLLGPGYSATPNPLHLLPNAYDSQVRCTTYFPAFAIEMFHAPIATFGGIRDFERALDHADLEPLDKSVLWRAVPWVTH